MLLVIEVEESENSSVRSDPQLPDHARPPGPYPECIPTALTGRRESSKWSAGLPMGLVTCLRRSRG